MLAPLLEMLQPHTSKGQNTQAEKFCLTESHLNLTPTRPGGGHSERTRLHQNMTHIISDNSRTLI